MTVFPKRGVVQLSKNSISDGCLGTEEYKTTCGQQLFSSMDIMNEVYRGRRKEVDMKIVIVIVMVIGNRERDRDRGR